jgi:hypothetical protein
MVDSRIETLSWACSAGVFLVTLYLIRTRGFLQGGRPAWLAVLLLAPVWFRASTASLVIDPRSACALAILVGLLLEPCDASRRSRWFLSDLAVLLLTLTVLVSQAVARDFALLSPLDQFRAFALPYVVGRLFLRNAGDIETILPSYCWIISILAAYSCFEAVSKINPIETILGRPWHTGESEYDAFRWGLRRAYALETHPIYLGLTFAMLLPFAIEAAICSFQKRGPYWWRFVPLIALAGVMSTVSRAAQLCTLIVLAVMFFHSFPRLRAPILILAAIGGVGFYAARDEVVAWLAQYAEETRVGETEYVQISTREGMVWKEYTGTKHRDLLDIVYEEAAAESGWLGYGTALKKMPRDPDMDVRFKSIDNHYLLFRLQYGWAGLAAFAFLAICLLMNVLPIFLFGRGAEGRLAAGLFGALGGGLIAMRSVWFSSDYAWVWLFCGGLSVCVARMRREAAGPGAPIRA